MIPLQEFQKRLRVLVAGGGLTALETASRIVELGYETILANPDEGPRTDPSLQPSDQALYGYARTLLEGLQGHPQCLYLEKTRLEKVEGFAGDFRVYLISGDRSSIEPVGAVVLAPGAPSAGPDSPVPEVDPRPWLTLDELAAALTAEDRPAAVAQACRPESYLAFVTGLNGSGGLAEMAQVLSAALKLREEFRTRVTIFTGQVKVADEGLERLYLACRDAGVLFFKFEENLPEFRVQDDRVAIQFADPLLGQPFELIPDLLVVGSKRSLPEDLRLLAEDFCLGTDRSGFLQPANVHLLPHRTLREGIFNAGPGKGPILMRAEIEEARGAALAVHEFFQGRETDPFNREVTVDKGLCTVCLTCLRFCPHQAIGFTHRIFIHPLACRRCGICAGECPMDAIQIQGYGDSDVDERLADIAAAWKREAVSGPRVVVFGCQRSAGEAWGQAFSKERGAQGAERGAQSGEGPDTTFMEKAGGSAAFIGLPCAGKLDTDGVLKALTLGADGVLILACPEENCRSLHGNDYARRRLSEAREYLEEAGIDPERLRFDTLSSNMVHALHEIMERFLEDLEGQQN